MNDFSNAAYAPDLHGFIDFLDAEHPDQIIRITKEVDPKFEVSGMALRYRSSTFGYNTNQKRKINKPHG